MLALPAPEETVKVAVQPALPGDEFATRVHGDPANVPEMPVSENPTVPPGVRREPAVELSVTVAVQVEG